MERTINFLLLFLMTTFLYAQDVQNSEHKDFISDTSFISLNNLKHDIAFDFRYATKNNFLKEQVYDCVDCVLRNIVAQALIRVNKGLKEKGYRLRLFDCYRPIDIQKKKWEIFPNASYVANPYKKGSIHNRGAAVDLTIETLSGNIVDMGTDFDHFGIEAHTDNLELEKNILDNRKILRDAMTKEGFSSIRSEWWHFNYKNARAYELSNFKFDCTK